MRDQDFQIGPAFAALTEKQRRFVLALFDAPKSHGSLTFAARAAGYNASTADSLHSIAHQLGSDPKIEAAISELSRQYLVTLGPRAVRAMRKVLDDDKHRDFGRVIGIVMDRVSPTQSTAVLKVEGEVKVSSADAARVLERIEELTAKFMPSLSAPKIIDHEPAQ